jgi:uncharacterized membrane protein
MASTTEEGFTIPRYVILALIVAFAIMAVFAIIASENPDGLERMFEAVGVEGAEGGGFLSFGEGVAADLLTMAVGMAIVFAIIIVIMLAVRYLKRS